MMGYYCREAKMSLKDKIKQTTLGITIGAASMSPISAQNMQSTSQNVKQYTKTITVRNDSVQMVGNTSAYYNSKDDQIYIKKGDMQWSDFGFKNTPRQNDEELQIIHESQHQINRSKKHLGSANMNLNENYQRDVHDEITALIAEKLEIHRQYRAAKTQAEKEAIIKKYAQNEEHRSYISAIKEGKIKPDSNKSTDFDKEMAFIKNDATTYRADPNDDGYKEQWTQLSMSYLNRVGNNAQSNPAALEQEIHDIYQIGGIDFTKYGEHKVMVLENQSIKAADNLLQQGAEPQKLIAFMNEGEGPFKLAESLDVSGLSQEQAEKVIQTAIMTQGLQENITEDICFNRQGNYAFNFIAADLKEKTAVYLDMKSDIWEKNGTLSPTGDEVKFNQLMEQAKTITLDTQEWYKNAKENLSHYSEAQTEEGRQKLLESVKQNQGKTINIDNFITNMNEFELPLDGTSKEEVLEERAQKAKEDADFWKEYYKTHPQEKKRLSDPYEKKIMNLESDILKDEWLARQKEEEKSQKIEPLYQSPRNTTYTLSDGGITMDIPNNKYQNAELMQIQNANGEILDLTLLDGKPHGLYSIIDKDGKVQSFKLYDKGKEVDLKQHNVEIQKEAKDGALHEYLLLDGKKFGTEIITGADGTQKAAFWDTLGLINGAENATIKTKKAHTDDYISTPLRPEFQTDTAERMELKKELKNQVGETPQQTPENTVKQLRFEMHIKAHQDNTQAPDELSGKKATNETKKENTTRFNIPIWQQQHTR